MNSPQSRTVRQWLSEEWKKLNQDEVYRRSVIFLVVNLLGACGLWVAFWGREKVVIAVAAGFVVVAEGVIDFSSELSAESKEGLQGIKLIYRFLGAVAAIWAVAADK